MLHGLGLELLFVKEKSFDHLFESIEVLNTLDISNVWWKIVELVGGSKLKWMFVIIKRSFKLNVVIRSEGESRLSLQLNFQVIREFW